MENCEHNWTESDKCPLCLVKTTGNKSASVTGLCCANTDKEIWRETQDDYYSPSIHATEDGKIGISDGGSVFVKDIRDWHKLASENAA